MIRDPRYAFDQLFGVGATPEERAARRRTRTRAFSTGSTTEVSRLRNTLGPSDRARLDSYLDDVQRDRATHPAASKRRTRSGEQRELPGAPAGVPDSFTEHVKLMYDLQALAFAGDITRVFSFKTGRDGSARVYPESGVNLPFHPASHHGEREDRVTQFAAINKYQVGLLPYFLDKLKSIKEGDGNLLDQPLIVYGSPMGNSNVHNHKRCPLFLAGTRRWDVEGRPAPESRRRHVDGERVPDPRRMVSASICKLRRQHGPSSS